ncbi:hypothetical protein [Brevundimonas bacteroides]|uniref:hypothetical protein n=1 Tax=Brevundimonas bacteroides TaxID=74311 RepID=UPI00049822B1|nr:hypothetical protein [Brevundimonas bacteroides]
MDRTEYGREAARRLHDAEAKLDLALAAINGLSAHLTSGRIDQEITAVIGQDALAAITEAQGPVVKARARLLKAHRAMKADARRLGIQWRLGGPFEDKPDEDQPVPRPTGRHLEAVA